MSTMTNVQSGDTITIKLMSGEEVVARLEEIKDDVLVVNKPRAIVNIPNKGIGLGPFVFTIPQDTTIEIYKKNVVCFGETEGTMARQYTEGTTGLTLPQ